MTPTSFLIRLAHNARQRAHLAGAAGDQARYWRELGSAMRLLGWTDSAADFDRLGETT
jgi:hypothetical protein